MLSDGEWWVRYRSAKALLALPGIDGIALEALGAALTTGMRAPCSRR